MHSHIALDDSFLLFSQQPDKFVLLYNRPTDLNDLQKCDRNGKPTSDDVHSYPDIQRNAIILKQNQYVFLSTYSYCQHVKGIYQCRRESHHKFALHLETYGFIR